MNIIHESRSVVKSISTLGMQDWRGARVTCGIMSCSEFVLLVVALVAVPRGVSMSSDDPRSVRCGHCRCSRCICAGGLC
jgi:hypothetical protein